MSRRESESEDEKLRHCLVSNVYSRDQLMSIRESVLSQKQPAFLSHDFDNLLSEDGRFVPEKWLEYRWMCDGVENRPSAGPRRKDKLKAEVLDGDSTVLSPQRRAFSSGCRAASPPKNDADSERLAANKGNWRSGAGFLMKNPSSNDFKPSFQKGALGSGDSYSKTRLANGGSSSNSNWRAAGDGVFRPNFHKDSTQGRNRGMYGEEKMPEWVDEGPTSMSDMIELKGFDDENKSKKKNKRETVASKQLQQAQQRAAAAARASGSGTGNIPTPLSAIQQQTKDKDKDNSKENTVGSRASSRGSTVSVNTVPVPATGNVTVSGNSNAKTNENVKTTVPTVAKSLASEAGPGGGTESVVSSETSGRTEADKEQKKQKEDENTGDMSIPADLAASMTPILNGRIPNSDAEFAKIMGILGEGDLDTLKQDSGGSSRVLTSAAPSVTGSRLSRFFASSHTQEQHHNTADSGDSNNNSGTSRASPRVGILPTPSANPILQKIFASSPQQPRSAQSPAVPEARNAMPVSGMVHVEDLERGFQLDAASSNNSAHEPSSTAQQQLIGTYSDGSQHLRALGIDARNAHSSAKQMASSQVKVCRGNPLCDPYQQAHLMNKLSRFASQQEGGGPDPPTASGVSMAPPPPRMGTARPPRTGASPTSPPMGMGVAQLMAQMQAQAQVQAHAQAQGAQKYGSMPSADAATMQAQAAAYMRSQYEAAALVQALAASQQQQQQRPHNPQAAAELNAMRSMLAGMVAAGAIPQSSAGPSMNTSTMGNGGMNTTPSQMRPNTTQMQSGFIPGSMPSGFMPTSVMRQLTKNQAHDDKYRRHLATSNAAGTAATAAGSTTTTSNATGNGTPSATEDGRRSATTVPHQQDNANATASATAAHKQSGEMPPNNSMDMMTRLALQQQYAQVVAAMQGGLSMGALRAPNAQMAASMRAQALAAAQAEHQRQFALAVMRGDPQAQAIRARFLTQQAAAVANMPNLVGKHQQQHHNTTGTPILGANSIGGQAGSSSSGPAPQPSTSQPLKFQNPLEKLLQSAGVTSNQQHANKTATNHESHQAHGGAAASSGGMPSIMSRLPPSANCISVEELERQFAAK